MGGVEEVSFLDLLQHRVVGAMPGLQQRVGGDEHRQVVVPKVVKDLRKTPAAQPLAHHEAVRPEGGEFSFVQPEVHGAIPRIAPLLTLVHDVRIRVELVPKMSGGWVPRNAGKVVRAVGKHRCELLGRNLPDALKCSSESISIAKDFRSA